MYKQFFKRFFDFFISSVALIIVSPIIIVVAFSRAVYKMLQSDLKQMGENGDQFYLNNYTVKHTCNAIIKHFN